MKKNLFCILIFVLAFTLVACGGRSGKDFDKPDDLYTFEATGRIT